MSLVEPSIGEKREFPVSVIERFHYKECCVHDIVAHMHTIMLSWQHYSWEFRRVRYCLQCYTGVCPCV